MIRRGFWLTTGAVTGIVAYRRVSMVGRHLSGRLNLDPSARTATATARTASARTASASARPTGANAWTVRRTRRGAIRAARETYRFTRDVREGMALHMARHSGPAGPNLSTNHDAQPEDGY